MYVHLLAYCICIISLFIVYYVLPSPDIDLDMAIAYWNLCLRGRYLYLDLWCQFLQVRGNYQLAICLYVTYGLSILQEHHKKAISRDTWNLFLEFTTTVDEQFSNYDEEGELVCTVMPSQYCLCTYVVYICFLYRCLASAHRRLCGVQ